MAPVQQLRRLIAYNQWADEKILAAIDGMTDAELGRPVDAYFGTLAESLRHTWGAQRVWLARWQGEAAQVAGLAAPGPWREAYARCHADLRAYVHALGEADGERVVAWTDSKGNARRAPLGQLIVHLVNHGTQHRAETGLLLERLGRSPGDLDYLYFCLQRR